MKFTTAIGVTTGVNVSAKQDDERQITNKQYFGQALVGCRIPYRIRKSAQLFVVQTSISIINWEVYFKHTKRELEEMIGKS